MFTENRTLFKEYGTYSYEHCKEKYSIREIAKSFIVRDYKMRLH
jgi:hypothetical protein